MTATAQVVEASELDLPFLPIEDPAFSLDPVARFAAARRHHPWLARTSVCYILTEHAAMRDIMHACVDAGGTITGEHGVGFDKVPYMELIFSQESLATMCSLRDVFDPQHRSNPGKVVPLHACREWHAAPSARLAQTHQ